MTYNIDLDYSLNAFNNADSQEGDSWGNRWRAIHQIRYNTIINFLCKHFPKNSTLKVLDVGCAVGDFSEKIIDKFPNISLTGIDISENAIKVVSKRIPQGKFKQVTLPDLPFEDESFDLILTNSVLSMITNEGQLLIMKQLNRVLKKDGYFFYSSAIYENQKFGSVRGSQKLLKQHFNIIDIEFIHMKYAIKFEYLFFRPYEISTIITKSFQIKSEWSKPKKILSTLLNNSLFCNLIILISSPFINACKFIMSQKWIFKTIQFFSKHYAYESSKRFIMILAKK